VADRSVSVPMTLSGLERRDARGQTQIFLDLHNYSYGLTYDDRDWNGNTGGAKHVSRGQPRPHPNWSGPRLPKILGTPPYAQMA